MHADTIRDVDENIKGRYFCPQSSYGLDLSKIHKDLQKERETGVGNSPLNRLLLLQGLKAKMKDPQNASLVNYMRPLYDSLKKRVMREFGLTEKHIENLPAYKKQASSSLKDESVVRKVHKKRRFSFPLLNRISQRFKSYFMAKLSFFR